MVTYGQLVKSIEAQKPRSAWEKGVKEYALSLILDYNEGRLKMSSKVPNLGKLESMLLDGTDDWYQYSRYGMGLVYTEAIAKRLSTPSELKKVRGKYGRIRDPSPYEDWCDVEGRALNQAFDLIKRTYLALNGQSGIY